jgi:hypothetical protein
LLNTTLNAIELTPDDIKCKGKGDAIECAIHLKEGSNRLNAEMQVLPAGKENIKNPEG